MSREESREHKRLKEHLARKPESLEEGLEFLEEEHFFVTGDRADLLFRDRYGRFVVVEVEREVGRDDLAGLLQAIKYKCMLAVEKDVPFNEVRAFLVAYKIDPTVKKVCEKYQVATKEFKI